MNTQITAKQWQEIEFELCAQSEYSNAYTDVEVWADFTHSNGEVLRRPAFWDGGNTWKVRFASPVADGEWKYQTFANVKDTGLQNQSGTIACASNNSEHKFYQRGFWRMSPGGRNLVYRDGEPCLLVGDTAWALPWRATPEQCVEYARDRQRKGFNAALLMVVQPDMKAEGPRSRTEDYGFDVGFEDLPQGHLNKINIEYFQTMDGLISTLVEHEIVPVYQPVFHGYGWKGLDVAGLVVSPEEYARFCRYLVARYGARPAIYLIGGDGKGYYESIGAGGAEVHKWDCYNQPTGIHYCPHADNRAYQDAEWLDFQWCQTGHDGDHMPERVADMWRNEPPKGVANAEPTYENIGKPGRGAGWWQGHEAWCNMCAGGTMGTVYGAGSLWQWKLHANEPGHQTWCEAQGAGWREALDFEGSNYIGVLSKIFDGLPFAEMQPNWDYTIGKRGLAIPDKLLIVYLPEGGDLTLVSERIPSPYRVLDPMTGELVDSGELDRVKTDYRVLKAEGGAPRIYIFCDEF